MKKKHKRVFGILGLILVVVITAVAASLPYSNEVQASETTSVTDTINVRVVGSTPSTTLSGIVADSITVVPHESAKLTYENVAEITVRLNRTNNAGETTSFVLDQWNADYYPGEKDYILDLDSYISGAETYGYGDYIIHVEGIGFDGIKVEDSIPFHYYPVIGDISTNDDSGFAILNLDYLPENDKSDEGHVDKVRVDMYDENGTLVWSTLVDQPKKSVVLPDLEDGLYRIELTAYNKSNALLFRAYTLKIRYENEIPIPVPDTGSFTQGINLARTDYLITGLVIFSVITVAALITLKKTNPNKSRAHVSVKRHKIKK